MNFTRNILSCRVLFKKTFGGQSSILFVIRRVYGVRMEATCEINDGIYSLVLALLLTIANGIACMT